MSMSWYFSLTEKSVNNTANTSVVTAELWVKVTAGEGSTQYRDYTLTVDGKSYTGQAQTNPNLIASDHKTVISKDVTVTHNADGTKKCTASVSYDSPWGTKSFSKTITLTTIPRASDLTVGSGTLGTAQTITASRKASSYTHTLTWKIGTHSGTCIDGSGSSISKSSAVSWSWTPDMAWAAYVTSSTSISCTVTLETFNGSTSVGTKSSTITLNIPESVKPSVSIAVTDAKGYADIFGRYIQSKSQMAITITAEKASGADIDAYNLTADGSYSGSDMTITGTTATITTAEISKGEGFQISATVTDTRKRSASAQAEVSVYSYSKPKISGFKAERCTAAGELDDAGQYLKCTYAFSITQFGVEAGYTDNAKTIKLQYKKKAASDWTEVCVDSAYSASTSKVIGSGGVENTSSYDVRLAVTDSFGTVYSSYDVPTMDCLIDARQGGDGLTIGGAAEKPGFVSKFDAEFAGTVTLDNEPTADSHAATKKYVDDAEAAAKGYADDTILPAAKSYADGKVAGKVGASFGTYSPADAVTVSSGVWTTVLSFTFESGKLYYMKLVGRFAKNATGFRMLRATDDGTDTGIAVRYQANVPSVGSSEYTYLEYNEIIQGTGKTIAFKAYQNSGSKLAVMPRLAFIRFG